MIQFPRCERSSIFITLRQAIFLSTLLLSLSTQILRAQDVLLIDKLREDLRSAEGPRRFELMNALAWEYRSAFPDSAIKYAEQALTLSEKLNLSAEQPKSLNYLGLAHFYKGNFVRAYENYQRALTRATDGSDSVQMGYALNNIGRLFSEQGMITQSYPYFVKAELIFRSVDELSGLAYVYQSFGALYRLQGDFLDAEQYYHRALKLRESLGNPRDIASAMVLLGMVYSDVQRFDDAFLFFRKADSTGRTIQDSLTQGEIKILIGEYYLNKGNVEEAARISTEGLAYIEKVYNVKLIARAHIVLGKVDLARSDYRSAKQHFTLVKNVGSRMKYFDLEILGNYFLWKVAEAEGNRSDVLFYSNRYLGLRDSINNLDISERVAKFQFQVDMDKKQQENELLKTNDRENKATILQQNQQRVGLMVVSTLLLALLYFQWRNARKQRRSNVILTEQRDEIASQATEISNVNSALQNHLTTLFDFSKSKSVNFGSMDEAAMDIARLTAKTLSVSRVSIWTYVKETNTIDSIVCYELATDSFKEKMSLSLSAYPEYAKALLSKKVINAKDARTNPETREFTDSYLVPLNIYSMLDVTYSIDGQLGGLLCCEQQGGPREWKSDDLIFTSSVSDIITLTLRSVQRREYEKQLRQHSREIERVNETLERRVAERTLELESQIRKAIDASKALQVSEERYRSIIAVSNTGAWEYHIETGGIWYSAEYFAMLGIEKPGGHWDDTLEANWVARLHPDDREKSIKVVDDFLKGGAVDWYENIYRMGHQNGEWVWIWSRGRRLRDANGELTNTILGTHIDITARKIAEEKIEQNAQLIRKITSQVPANTYMFEIDERGVANILFLNRGTEEYNHNMDLQGESESSDRIREIIHEDDKLRFVERMKEAYNTVQPISFQYRIIVNETIRWRWMKAVPDKDQNGKILWYGATSDITALVDYIISVEQIIFDIGHVIRRPVSSMLGMTSLIIDNNLPIDDIKEISQKLHKISQEMDKFSRELNDAYHEKSQIGKFNIDVSSSVDKRTTLFTE